MLENIANSNTIDAGMMGTKSISCGNARKLRNKQRLSSPNQPNQFQFMPAMLSGA